MTLKAALRRADRIGLFSLRAGSSARVDSPATTSSSARRFSRLLGMAKRIFKRDGTKATAHSAPTMSSISTCTVSKGNDAALARVSHCSYSTDATVGNEDCSARSSSASDKPCKPAAATPATAVACHNEPMAEAQETACQDESAQDIADYCAALTEHRRDMVRLQKKCVVDYGSGLFWKLKQSKALRMDVFDWLAHIVMLNDLDPTFLHLAMQYLDHFVTDFDKPIEPRHLRVYAYVCFFLAIRSSKHAPTSRLAMPAHDIDKFAKEHFVVAFGQVIETLDWCLEVVRDETDTSIKRSVDPPTMFDFLYVIFERAAIEMPELFADPEQARQDIGAEEPFPRSFAMGPFSRACHIASALLRSELCLTFRTSELAAISFHVAVQDEEIDPSVFKRCTGCSLKSLNLVRLFAHSVFEFKDF
ncbi:hypothetical protein LPJ56_003740 [Coemansia sp. RSA 2599]|nr:hypothetical protein LPJ56_003740 [Coemansia sp. RSA 2599]